MGNSTWQAALQRLKSGNESFCGGRTENRKRDVARCKALLNDQQPFAVVLSCSDSRVVPEFVFDVGLGDLFVVRVAGIVPNPSSIASIEFCVAHLGVKLIVVMGHECCGAVAAAIKGGDGGKNLNQLFAFIKPAVVEARRNDVNTVGKINCRNSAATLVHESDILATAVRKKDVQTLTAFFYLGSGRVDFSK